MSTTDDDFVFEEITVVTVVIAVVIIAEDFTHTAMIYSIKKGGKRDDVSSIRQRWWLLADSHSIDPTLQNVVNEGKQKKNYELFVCLFVLWVFGVPSFVVVVVGFVCATKKRKKKRGTGKTNAPA